MPELFKNNGRAYYLLDKSKTERALSRILRVAGFGFASYGLLQISASTTFILFAPDEADRLILKGSLMFLGGLTAGIYGYVLKARSKDKEEQAIYEFNNPSENMKLGYKYIPYFKFDFTDDGFGLVYVF